MKFIAVIPAHLASVRFPNKILFDFFGLPMIEHVRRRALLSGYLSEVYVATCDKAIAEIVSAYYWS
jgi:3-deoxy-manno-octulosonate cytidylyltransferase (CMP-KDO synthetase)